MVEMLGVLAIIGVLSVVGLAVYRVAIDKHRANTLLNEAQKRAIIVATQFLSGREFASITDFSDHSVFPGGTFDDGAEIKLENGQFKIPLTEVFPEVCQQMKNMIGSESFIKKVVCSTSTKGWGQFIFNADGSNTVLLGQLCNTAQDIYCQYGQICNTDGKVAGQCLDKKDSSECLINADCPSGKYCKVTATSNTNITNGECSDLGESSGEKLIDFGEEGKIKVERSTTETGMNYFSAKNWCEAKGKKLLDVSGTRMGCYSPTDGTTLLSYGGNAVLSNVNVNCCAQGSTDCGNDINKQSTKMKNLRNAMYISGKNCLWTGTSYNTSNRSVYRLCVNTGHLGNNGTYIYQSHDNFAALCEEIK